MKKGGLVVAVLFTWVGYSDATYDYFFKGLALGVAFFAGIIAYRRISCLERSLAAQSGSMCIFEKSLTDIEIRHGCLLNEMQQNAKKLELRHDAEFERHWRYIIDLCAIETGRKKNEVEAKKNITHLAARFHTLEQLVDSLHSEKVEKSFALHSRLDALEQSFSVFGRNAFPKQ